MKKLLVIIFPLLLFVVLSINAHAEITTAPLNDVQKATLTRGLKGSFCKVNNVNVEEVLTMHDGLAPNDFYNNMYKKADCSESEKNKEIIIGEVMLEHEGNYKSNDSFFIVDNVMYRAGLKYFEYYENASDGGTYKDFFTNNSMTGLEVVGSNYFFESEHDNDASKGARLKNSGFVTHYELSGINGWILIAYNNNVYKLTDIIKEDHDLVLLDNTQPSPTVILDNESSKSPIPSIPNITPTNYPLTPPSGSTPPDELGISLSLASTSQIIRINFEKPELIKSYEYEATYDALINDELVPRGSSGSGITTPIPGTIDYEMITLGTCINGMCQYDEGVKSVKIRLTLTLQNESIKIVEKYIYLSH